MPTSGTWRHSRGSRLPYPLGAKAHSSSQPQNVNIAFPSNNQGASVTFDPNAANNPLPATKDRTAVTARWAAHDDNGDDLTFSLFLRGDGEKAWRRLKDNLTEKAYTF